MPVMNDTIARHPVDGAYKLALRFPAGALKGSGAALSAAMSEDGFLVSGGASSPWRFEAIVREGDEALLLGPDFEGHSLGESADPGAGLPRLLAVARALSLLRAGGLLPRDLRASGILVSEERGEVLVLPPAAAAKALPLPSGRPSGRPSGDGAKAAEAEASSLLARAAYRIAVGKEPLDGGKIPMGIAAPRLHPGLASLVDAALSDPAGAGLEAWAAALEAAREAGWTHELPPGAEAEISRRRASLEAGELAARRRADFFRRRGGVLLAVAVAVAVIALIGTDMIRAQLGKPDYSWLTPRELVQRYYLAVDGLDLDSLEACGDKKAIKDDQSYIINLVVITKTRTAYEGKSPVVRAVDWLAAGKPALKAEDFLYGLAGLSISGGESVPAGATSVSIEARYSFWSLDRKEDPSGEPSKSYSVPLENRRVDSLALERGKKGWRIVGLARKVLP